MSVTLTAGGRAGVPARTDKTQAQLLNEWDRLVRRMLTLSSATHKTRERVLQMRAWLEANPWHPKFAERDRQYHAEYAAHCAECNPILDLSSEACRLQARFDEATRAGMSALLGHELFPNAPCVWVVYARRLGTDDLFEIASFWMREMRQEDERHHGTEHAA